jgi:hypothetical protein
MIATNVHMRTTPLLLLLALSACGQATMTPIDSGSNATCDTKMQSACGSGQKCSINLSDGTPHCTTSGSKTAYDACANDGECIAGTTCVNTPANSMFLGGQVCHPLCDPSTSAHLSCTLGGTCEIQDLVETTIGFCVLPVPADGGP